MNCELVFNHIVDNTLGYMKHYQLKAMVLGISGGIDSTVVAAICHEVSKRSDVKFIGRSLPIKNSVSEVNIADMVGKALCDDYQECNLGKMYGSVLESINNFEGMELTPIAKGNIQARLRMIYLYNLAGMNGGLVMDTDNRSENLLGFWSVCGDVGDLKPIGNLFKTEVYELAEYLADKYEKEGEFDTAKAIRMSIELKPTDGLGISDGDEAQIGASYAVVDDIFFTLFTANHSAQEQMEAFDRLHEKYGQDVVHGVIERNLRTEYKRQPIPMLLLDSDGFGTMAEALRKNNTVIKPSEVPSDGQN